MIVSEQHRENLIKIAKKFERKSQSFPQDDNGEPTEAYLEYISMMFSLEVAEIVKDLEVFPKTTSLFKLAKMLNRDRNDIEKILEEPSSRFFITKASKYYALPTPLFIYDAPFVLKKNYDSEEVKQFAKLSKHFFEKDKYYKRWETSRKGTPRMRILPVQEELEPETTILPVEEVYSVIDKFDNFALIPCPCRKRTEVIGIRKCKDKYPILNCILMGRMAQMMNLIEDPVNRQVSKEEVIENVKKSAELGLVLATDNHASNTVILCSCCECCCGMLRGICEFDNPRAIAKSNFVAQVDKDACIGCETCLSRCKFGAIIVDTTAEIDSQKCMGCGLCAVTCPEKALSMKRLDREEIPGLEA